MNESSWGRVPGVLVSPARTFERIVEHPSFLPPLLVLMLAGIAFGVVATTKIDYGETIRATLEARGVDMPEADFDRGVALAERFAWVFALLGSLVFQPAGLLLMALVFWIVFKLLGSEMSYRHGLSVTLHASLPFALVAIASIPVVMGREFLTAEELQGGLLLSNLGFLAGEDAPAWLGAALRCIDFFGLWVLALFTIGFRAATKLRPSTVTATVVALWIAWCAVKVGWAGVTSMFG